MGAELDSPCSGCDICVGKAVDEPEGLGELRSFLAANPGRFSLEDAIRLLGARGPGAAGSTGREEPPACAGEGLLADWDRKDLRVLLTSAIGRGQVERIEAGLRAGRLKLAANMCRPPVESLQIP